MVPDNQAVDHGTLNTQLCFKIVEQITVSIDQLRFSTLEILCSRLQCVTCRDGQYHLGAMCVIEKEMATVWKRAEKYSSCVQNGVKKRCCVVAGLVRVVETEALFPLLPC